MEFVDDLAVRYRLWKLNPRLLEMVGTPVKAKGIVVFRISRGKFIYWTWENNIDPEPWADSS